LTIAKRARQVGELHKRHIDRYLGQTEMLEQAAARARADDSDELPEIEPIERPKLRFDKPVVLAMREMKEGKIERYYEE
jgi:DNA-directed RNA polymerase subunit K/omega